MPIEKILNLPYPDGVEDGPVKDYLLLLRDALVADSAQLAETIETRLSDKIVNLTGTPSANQLATWSDADTIQAATGLANINDTANANMTIGLNINQGANDDEILAFKSSDVAHGVTSIAETDTYGTLKKQGAADGGLKVTGLTEQSLAVALVGYYTVAETTQGETATGAINLGAYKKNGANITFPDTGQNLVVVMTLDAASAYKARWLCDNNGNTWQYGYVIPAGGYKAADGTAGATAADVDTAATPHLVFKNGLFISAGTGA